ncbi:MAG: DUF1905 domain-containing protein [Cytophagaceae bacterium]
MKSSSESFEFTAVVWQYDGPGGWCFVSLPKGMSTTIRKYFKSEEEGWGRLKAKATIGNTTWDTAIWFDSKSDGYLLPLKAEVRKKEKLTLDMKVKVLLKIDGSILSKNK